MFNHSEDKFIFFKQKLKNNKTKDIEKSLYILLDMSTECPYIDNAIKFIEELDKIINIYISPNGSIAINGYKDNLVKYKTFKSY